MPRTPGLKTWRDDEGLHLRAAWWSWLWWPPAELREAVGGLVLCCVLAASGVGGLVFSVRNGYDWTMIAFPTLLALIFVPAGLLGVGLALKKIGYCLTVGRRRFLIGPRQFHVRQGRKERVVPLDYTRLAGTRDDEPGNPLVALHASYGLGTVHHRRLRTLLLRAGHAARRDRRLLLVGRGLPLAPIRAGGGVWYRAAMGSAAVLVACLIGGAIFMAVIGLSGQATAGRVDWLVQVVAAGAGLTVSAFVVLHYWPTTGEVRFTPRAVFVRSGRHRWRAPLEDVTGVERRQNEVRLHTIHHGESPRLKSPNRRAADRLTATLNEAFALGPPTARGFEVLPAAD